LSFVRGLLLSLAAAAAGAVAFGDAGRDEMVSVGLYFGDTAPRSVMVTGQGRFQGSQSSGNFEGGLRVRANGDKLAVGRFADETEVGCWVELYPVGINPWLELAGYAYRGRLRIALQSDGALKIINILGLEDYLRGVLANEMFADPEGFKVQAVACRTLALYVRDDQRRHAGDGFDLCAEGHCQVYHGVDSEIPLSDQAIRATRGEVLTFKGRPLLAAYHANAGGATDEVEDVWPGSIKQDFAYLSHVQSPFDRSAEKLPGYQWCYQWQRQISLHEVSDRLAARGQQVGEIGDLIVRRKTKSGRVRELEVVGTKGRAHVAGAARVADVLGMPSSKLELSILEANGH